MYLQSLSGQTTLVQHGAGRGTGRGAGRAVLQVGEPRTPTLGRGTWSAARVWSRTPGQEPETCHAQQDAASKRVAIATAGFAVIAWGTFRSLHPPASFPPPQHKPCSNCQSLGASWVHRGFIADLEMPSVKLLALLLCPAMTITVWFNQLWRTPRETQAKEPLIPVLCVPPRCVQAATKCLLSITATLPRFLQRGHQHCGALVQQA